MNNIRVSQSEGNFLTPGAGDHYLLRRLIHGPNQMSLFRCSRRTVQVRASLCEHFVTKYVFTARSCQHLAQSQSWRTTPFRDVFFLNIFAATLHIGGRSSIRKLRALHAVVTGTHISRTGSVIRPHSAVMFNDTLLNSTGIISSYRIE